MTLLLVDPFGTNSTAPAEIDLWWSIAPSERRQ
jgi:hypothetical protein